MNNRQPNVKTIKTCVLIPARGGSKGIKNKNLKNFCGKPLLAWTIEQALSSELVDHVFVSTDSPDIAKVASDCGAKVPFLRPAEISTDTSATEDAIRHFIGWLASASLKCETIILLQATSPIRNIGSIDAAIEKFKTDKLDSLLSVCESHHFYWRLSPDGTATASYDIFQRPRRQDIKTYDKVYTENGSIYIFSATGFNNSQNRLFGKIGLFEMSEDESHEIDSQYDFKFCEHLMREKLRLKNAKK